MTISSLTSAMPSLVDYLSKNNASTSSTGIPGYSTGSSTLDLSSLLNADSSDGDTVSLSSTAQLMLSQGVTDPTAVAADADGGTAAKSGAQDFFKNFFTALGVDGTKLSDDAKSLVQGISDLIDNMGPVTRDSTIDSMTQKYVRGERESYTLQGTNERLSLTIQYKDGKPSSMTVMQLQGSTANNAVISLGTDAKGALSTVDVNRIQKQFSQYGSLLTTTPGTSLSLDLYKSASDTTVDTTA